MQQNEQPPNQTDSVNLRPFSRDNAAIDHSNTQEIKVDQDKDAGGHINASSIEVFRRSEDPRSNAHLLAGSGQNTDQNSPSNHGTYESQDDSKISSKDASKLSPNDSKETLSKESTRNERQSSGQGIEGQDYADRHLTGEKIVLLNAPVSNNKQHQITKKASESKVKNPSNSSDKKKSDRSRPSKNDKYQKRESRQVRMSRMTSPYRKIKQNQQNEDLDFEEGIASKERLNNSGGEHTSQKNIADLGRKKSPSDVSDYIVEPERKGWDRGNMGNDTHFSGLESNSNQGQTLDGRGKREENLLAISNELERSLDNARQRVQAGQQFPRSYNQTETTVNNNATYLSFQAPQDASMMIPSLYTKSDILKEDQEVAAINNKQQVNRGGDPIGSNQTNDSIRSIRVPRPIDSAVEEHIRALKYRNHANFQSKHQNISHLASQILYSSQQQQLPADFVHTFSILNPISSKPRTQVKNRTLDIQESIKNNEDAEEDLSSPEPAMVITHSKLDHTEHVVQDDPVVRESRKQASSRVTKHQTKSKSKWHHQQQYKPLPLKESNIMPPTRNPDNPDLIKKLGRQFRKINERLGISGGRHPGQSSQKVLLIRDPSGQVYAEGKISPHNLDPKPKIDFDMVENGLPTGVQTEMRLQGSQHPHNSHMFKLQFQSRVQSIGLVKQMSQKKCKIELQVDQDNNKIDRSPSVERQKILKEKKKSLRVFESKHLRMSKSTRGSLRRGQELQRHDGDNDSLDRPFYEGRGLRMLVREDSIQDMGTPIQRRSPANHEADSQGNLIQIDEDMSMKLLTSKLNEAIGERNHKRIYKLQMLRREGPETPKLKKSQNFTKNINSRATNSKLVLSPKLQNEQQVTDQQSLLEEKNSGSAKIETIMDGELAAMATVIKDDKESPEEKKNQNIESGDSPGAEKTSNSNWPMTKGSVSQHDGDSPPYANEVQNTSQYAKDDQRYWKFGLEAQQANKKFAIHEILNDKLQRQAVARKKEQQKRMEGVYKYREDLRLAEKYEKLRQTTRLYLSNLQKYQNRNQSMSHPYQKIINEKQLIYYNPYQELQMRSPAYKDELNKLKKNQKKKEVNVRMPDGQQQNDIASTLMHHDSTQRQLVSDSDQTQQGSRRLLVLNDQQSPMTLHELMGLHSPSISPFRALKEHEIAAAMLSGAASGLVGDLSQQLLFLSERVDSPMPKHDIDMNEERSPASSPSEPITIPNQLLQTEERDQDTRHPNTKVQSHNESKNRSPPIGTVPVAQLTKNQALTNKMANFHPSPLQRIYKQETLATEGSPNANERDVKRLEFKQASDVRTIRRSDEQSPAPKSTETSILREYEYQKKTPKYANIHLQIGNKEPKQSPNADLEALQDGSRKLNSNIKSPLKKKTNNGLQNELEEIHQEVVGKQKLETKERSHEILTLPQVTSIKTHSKVSQQQNQPPSAERQKQQLPADSAKSNSRGNLKNDDGSRLIRARPREIVGIKGEIQKFRKSDNKDYQTLDSQIRGDPVKTSVRVIVQATSGGNTDIITGSRNVALNMIGAAGTGRRFGLQDSKFQQRRGDLNLMRHKGQIRRSSLPEITPQKNQYDQGSLQQINQGRIHSHRNLFEKNQSRRDFTLAGATADGTSKDPQNERSSVGSLGSQRTSQLSLNQNKQIQSKQSLHMLDILKNHNNSNGRDLKKIKIRARINSVLDRHAVDVAEKHFLDSQRAAQGLYSTQPVNQMDSTQADISSQQVAPNQDGTLPGQLSRMQKAKHPHQRANSILNLGMHESRSVLAHHQLPGLVTQFGARALGDVRLDQPGSPMRNKKNPGHPDQMKPERNLELLQKKMSPPNRRQIKQLLDEMNKIGFDLMYQ